MAKRFTDTDKFKKPFIRSLPVAYKVFWEYICLDCDHAGIWQVDMEVAQIRIGHDAKIDEMEALKIFNSGEERVLVLQDGKRWFIRPFVEFQYGTLNPENRVHASVISTINSFANKPLIRPLQGPMDKDKDKDKEEDIGDRGVGKGNKKTEAIHYPEWLPLAEWNQYREMRKAIRKPVTKHGERLAITKLEKFKTNGEDVKAILEQSIFNSWQGLFSVKPDFKSRIPGDKTAGNLSAVQSFLTKNGFGKTQL